MRIRLGGIGGTAFWQQQHTTFLSTRDQREIHNRGVANSQVCQALASGNGGWSTSAAAPTTGAINTALVQDLVLSGQKDTAGEVLTLEAYLIELFYGA
jgi:hypothetical protein